MESNLICSVCKKELTKNDNFYICPDGHSYDIAKEGYVNLILANKKNSKQPGDNKEMMIARRNFLNSGAYNALVTNIINTLKGFVYDDTVIVEAGCGEGFYISNIKNSFPKSKCYGFDISKDAIKLASKSYKDVEFFVSSSYNCNIKSGSTDVALVIFAPFIEKEINRILASGGTVIIVKPRNEHLLELKEQLYNNVKKASQKLYNDFYIYKTICVTYVLKLNEENLQNLLKMTPFYYQTSIIKKQNLDYNKLKKGIKVDFLIEVLKKNKN